MLSFETCLDIYSIFQIELFSWCPRFWDLIYFIYDPVLDAWLVKGIPKFSQFHETSFSDFWSWCLYCLSVFCSEILCLCKWVSDYPLLSLLSDSVKLTLYWNLFRVEFCTWSYICTYFYSPKCNLLVVNTNIFFNFMWYAFYNSVTVSSF